SGLKGLLQPEAAHNQAIQEDAKISASLRVWNNRGNVVKLVDFIFSHRHAKAPRRLALRSQHKSKNEN
ncbi:MAG: hypothetical protein RQ724_04365, partial [Desulfuromonadales bacterium]|nr:hypothetical protein [Desulfuromonadales bacterium]